jgi:hypothetical protein
MWRQGLTLTAVKHFQTLGALPHFGKRIIFSATWDYEFSRKGMKGVEPKVMA